MFNPKVSIIIPVYNGANFLQHAISSALNQSYENVEVIVVNDGSTDGNATENVAKMYGDKIRYYCKENGGVASALNFGLAKMSGEYFSWLSHDDIYFSNKIAAQIGHLRATGKRNVILYSDWENIDGNGNSLGIRIIGAAEVEKNIYAVMNCVINGCTLLVPKKCFDETDIFDESLPTTQDYDLWFKMARKYEFVHLPKLLVRYRIHAAQDSHKHPDHLKEQNDLHIKFNRALSEAEILEVEKSVSLFYIKRAIFYKNKLVEAEQYAYAQFLKYLLREKISMLPECLLLMLKYKLIT